MTLRLALADGERRPSQLYPYPADGHGGNYRTAPVAAKYRACKVNGAGRNQNTHPAHGRRQNPGAEPEAEMNRVVGANLAGDMHRPPSR